MTPETTGEADKKKRMRRNLREIRRMWENPLFCKKAGFSHTLSRKKLLDCGR